MASIQGALIVRQIRKLVAAQCPSQRSDMQLLQQFLDDRDESAFAAIVQRHGPMVLSVCRSVLQHQQDAEDAFQATFLVLARKGNSIRKHGSLCSWLHGVAHRLSLKARTRSASQRASKVSGHAAEGNQIDSLVAAPIDDLTMRELQEILHEELDRIGEHYRTSLLLCYWQGKTRDEAAAELGMSAGAFKKCLDRARHLLRGRLLRRGLVPSAAFLATLFSASGVQAALPSVLINTTAQVAVAYAVGKTAGISAAPLALANGAIYSMNLTKCAMTTLLILLLGSLGTGLGFGGYLLVHGVAADQSANPMVAGEKHPPKDASVAQPAKSDKERIVGVWKIKSGVGNGENIPADLALFMRVHFESDGKLAIRVVEEAKRGKYDLVGPGKIDLVGPGDKDDLVEGIYKFDGNDVLTLCIKEGGNKKRPAEFAAAKGSGQTVLVLQRCKPGEEKVNPKDVAKVKGGDRVLEAAARAETANNLKQIGLAFHNYHSTVKEFPAHAIYSKDGKTPLLSWRVAILPYIEQAALYRQFKLDESWDSPHNKKLIPLMPKIFVIPGSKAKQGETYLQVFTGSDTPFDGPIAIQVAGITDGTSNTALVVEGKDSVVWTKPADLTLPKDKDKLPPVGTYFINGFHVLMCDGSVRLVPRTIEPATFRAMITPASGD